MTYDALLVFALWFGATGLYQAGAGLLGVGPTVGEHPTGEVINQLEPIASGPWFSAYLLLVMLAFFAWFWHRSGQTLGMQAWRLRIDNLNGGRISYSQATLRFFCAWLSFFCLGIGYIWVLFDRDKAAWHDHWSKSRVVVLPKVKKQK
jgi:uncharacterized RDD family membrane protein YckC